MKKTIVVVSLLLVAVFIFAQTPEWLWGDNTGGDYQNLGYGITTDSENNVFITGQFAV